MKSLQDLIQSATAYLADSHKKFATQMIVEGYDFARTWISAREHPPEQSGEYLASRFEGDRGCKVNYSIEYKGWNVGFDGDRVSELFPSHWMPLPEPPETKDTK